MFTNQMNKLQLALTLAQTLANVNVIDLAEHQYLS